MKEYKDSYKLFTKELVRNVDYIHGLSDNTVEEITYYLRQKHFEKDKILFRAGDSIDSIYFITNGSIKITVTINDTEVPLDTLYRGSSIGANGVLGHYNYNFTARTVSKVTLLVLTKESIKTLINC